MTKVKAIVANEPTEAQLATARKILANGGEWQRLSDETNPRTWDPGDDGTEWLYMFLGSPEDDRPVAILPCGRIVS